ncbi:uncharacterized protein LOC132172873 [Corylus avellana]|uniref:uncharacterized protein LOC132172873 n=1 Tax=Corylus avellana TaxID=13451 RepID=UPI001E213F99|nr:uncharacterized protein LOC132172873 [Corylus avellana]
MGKFFENLIPKTKYGAIAATVTPIIIAAGAYVAWSYASRARKRQRVLSRSMSVGYLHSGKLALQRLMNYHQARAEPEILDGAENELNTLLQDKHPDFWKLRSAAAKLEMSGKEAKAVEILENEFENARKDQKSHEGYEIEMLLVEMHIYKGDFRKAFERECLKDEVISDHRRPLFKAILHILMSEEHQEEEASQYWEDFDSIRNDFLWQPIMQEDKLEDVVPNFKEFKEVVNLLKKDIQEAVEAKKTQK